MKKRMSGKTYFLIFLGLAAVGLIAYLVINNQNAKNSATASLQTVEATRGELVAIIGATGTVRANQTADLKWQTNGRIGQIHVEVGDKVSSETVLAELLQTSLSQSIILAQSDLVEAQRKLDNLLHSNLQQAQAQLSLANAKDAYDRAVWSGLQGDTARTTNQNSIDAARAAVTLAQDKVDSAEETFSKFEDNDEDDPIRAGALSTLANARQNLENAKRDLNFLVQNPNEKELAISEGKVALARAEYEDAQREWERLKDGPDPDDIVAAESRIASIEATIGLAQIVAPFGGTVTEVIGMTGDQVSAGSAVFRLDDLSRLFVDVEVPEIDINRILIGQSVDLSFDAISNKTYQGRVHSVAQVGRVQNGLVNFSVVIEILNADEQVLPGMTAAVNIIISQIEDALIVPNRAIRLVDNQQVVYILKNGEPIAVNITIGSSSDSMSEVIAGDLKEGDKVILNPPSSFMDIHFGEGRPF
ncbi:MAG: efflux RND transporter periplasmic adaptor subunit [Anaerolineaceae bacterium]|nr:efflux RND transporter periplasmic adaptor subunit [Anaerolineaceae bacterium]